MVSRASDRRSLTINFGWLHGPVQKCIGVPSPWATGGEQQANSELMSRRHQVMLLRSSARKSLIWLRQTKFVRRLCYRRNSELQTELTGWQCCDLHNVAMESESVRWKSMILGNENGVRGFKKGWRTLIRLVKTHRHLKRPQL